MLQSWIPRQRYHDSATVIEIYREFIVAYADAHSARPFNLLYRRTHPRPPAAANGFEHSGCLLFEHSFAQARLIG
jgi:hypothetical protein